MNRMNLMIGDYFFLFYHLMNRMKQMAGAMYYLVHLVHLVMINSIQQRRYEYLAVGLIVFIAFAG